MSALIFGLPDSSRVDSAIQAGKRSESEKSLSDLDDLLTAVHPFETLAHLVGVALKRAHSLFPASSNGWLRRTQIFANRFVCRFVCQLYAIQRHSRKGVYP